MTPDHRKKNERLFLIGTGVIATIVLGSVVWFMIAFTRAMG